MKAHKLADLYVEAFLDVSLQCRVADGLRDVRYDILNTLVVRVSHCNISSLICANKCSAPEKLADFQAAVVSRDTRNTPPSSLAWPDPSF